MDIVERLRQEIGGYTDIYLEKAEANMQEAADEIERLREALRKIVKRDAGVNKFGEKDMSTLGWIAYNALKEKK
jgi:hypothetical protein